VIAICSNPAACLLDRETLSAFWRKVRRLLETVALLVICAAFHRVCYEGDVVLNLIQWLVAAVCESTLQIFPVGEINVFARGFPASG
jgi:hypothetical protein